MLPNAQIPLDPAVYEKYLLFLCHSPEYAQVYEVDDATNDNDENGDGDQDDCGKQEGLHRLLHPVDDAEQGDDVGQAPDQGPDEVAAAKVDDDTDGVDDPQHNQDEGGVLDVEVEIIHEAELLQTRRLRNFIHDSRHDCFVLF